VSEHHSSLDKTCPSLQAVIQKYKNKYRLLTWQLHGPNTKGKQVKHHSDAFRLI